MGRVLVICVPSPGTSFLTCHWLLRCRCNCGMDSFWGPSFPCLSPSYLKAQKHRTHKNDLDPSLGMPPPLSSSPSLLFIEHLLYNVLAWVLETQTIAVTLPFKFSTPLVCSLGTLLSSINPNTYGESPGWGSEDLGSRVLVLSQWAACPGQASCLLSA